MSSADGGHDDWTAPGIYPVAPGVHRIPLPLPNDALRAINVYAVEDAGGLVLVDSGWALAAARDRLVEALGTLGCGLGDVRQFLVTHVHRDHYTQAVAVRREFGPRVGLGKGEQPNLEIHADPGREPLSAQLNRLPACGARELQAVIRELLAREPEDLSLWEAPDQWLTEGTDTGLTDRNLRVLPTPGHAQGHVVFTDDQAGLLFAGDHILPHITPSIGFESVPAELPLRDYLESLRLVRELPDMRLLPAHGPAAPSVHCRIDELVAHHDARLDVTTSAVRSGATTAYQVAQLLPWTRRHRGSTTSTRSTRCLPSWRPPPTSTCSPRRVPSSPTPSTRSSTTASPDQAAGAGVRHPSRSATTRADGRQGRDSASDHQHPVAWDRKRRWSPASSRCRWEPWSN